MDGRSLDRRSERGHRFARELIASATSRARTWERARLGPTAMAIGTVTDDYLAGLIRGAFLPADPRMAPTFSLAVSRLGELPRLPSVEWARPWTETGRPVPAELTYPYRVFLDRQVGIAYAFDTATGKSAVWIRRERELDLRSFITPFRVLLSWMADTVDAEVVHASAAVVDGRAIALSGPSGSGKSTLAIGLGLSGHGLISDDCLLLHEDTVYAVFGRAKLDDEAASLVGAEGLTMATLPRTARAKRYFSVAELGERFVPQHQLDMWGFPALGSRPGHYPLSQRRAYRMLATDSMREVFGGGPRNLLRLGRSVRRHPAQRLLLGGSMAENAEVVRGSLTGEPWLTGARMTAEVS